MTIIEMDDMIAAMWFIAWLAIIAWTCSTEWKAAQSKERE